MMQMITKLEKIEKSAQYFISIHKIKPSANKKSMEKEKKRTLIVLSTPSAVLPCKIEKVREYQEKNQTNTKRNKKRSSSMIFYVLTLALGCEPMPNWESDLSHVARIRTQVLPYRARLEERICTPKRGAPSYLMTQNEQTRKFLLQKKIVCRIKQKK
jgi:hypothetical protein